MLLLPLRFSNLHLRTPSVNFSARWTVSECDKIDLVRTHLRRILGLKS